MTGPLSDPQVPGPEPEADAAPGPLRLSGILGHASDPDLHDRLHEMEHRGQVDLLRIQAAEAARKRMRLTSAQGRDCALILARDEALSDGAVLFLSDDLAILARVEGGPRLRLTPGDAAAALRLGYHCGNLHWKADFSLTAIEIRMEGPAETYLARLKDLEPLAAFAAEIVTGDNAADDDAAGEG